MLFTFETGDPSGFSCLYNNILCHVRLSRAERKSRRLLGIQVLGAGAVDKMVDIAVTGIYQGMKLDDFDTMDFAYAPPFSTAIHPFATACYILENKLDGVIDSMSPSEYASGAAKGYTVLDALPAPAIPNAKWVNLAKVTAPIEGLDKDAKLLLVCAVFEKAARAL